MPSSATYNELLKFLDYLSDKRLMKEQSVASRRAVVGKVFAALGDDDRSDVLAIDMDDVMTRFINKSGTNYSPASLQTYKSRLKSTLDDFSSYRENPMGFRPSSISRASRKSKTNSSMDESNHGDISSADANVRPAVSTRVASPSVDILPIPIRANLVVRVQGLPHDLSMTEANKIASVIKAFVVEE